MGNPNDFYEVLNIPKDSSPQEIRRAYKALCMKWHPDKHPPSSKPHAEARFKAITQAYEALHDRQSMFGFLSGDGGTNSSHSSPAPSPGHSDRRQHRSEELRPKQTTAAAAGKDFKDVHYSTPKGGFTNTASGRRKPPPVERKLECTLEELCRGCNKEVKFKRDVVTKEGLTVQQEETQTIRVKPGWKKGTKITFEGMGDERPGCLPSDAVFLISEKEHPTFKRVGNDLVLKVEVPLANALTGWTFSFRLLTGEKMTCSFKDEIIYPGYEKVIQDQGMPLANERGKKGLLRIKFHIIFPKQLNTEQRAGILELLKDST